MRIGLRAQGFKGHTFQFPICNLPFKKVLTYLLGSGTTFAQIGWLYKIPEVLIFPKYQVYKVQALDSSFSLFQSCFLA